MKIQDHERVTALIEIGGRCAESRRELRNMWEAEKDNPNVFALKVHGEENKYTPVGCLLTENVFETLMNDLEARIVYCSQELTKLGVDVGEVDFS